MSGKLQKIVFAFMAILNIVALVLATVTLAII